MSWLVNVICLVLLQIKFIALLHVFSCFVFYDAALRFICQHLLKREGAIFSFAPCNLKCGAVWLDALHVLAWNKRLQGRADGD
jgi:hypothetical protein